MLTTPACIRGRDAWDGAMGPGDVLFAIRAVDRTGKGSCNDEMDVKRCAGTKGDVHPRPFHHLLPRVFFWFVPDPLLLPSRYLFFGFNGHGLPDSRYVCI